MISAAPVIAAVLALHPTPCLGDKNDVERLPMIGQAIASVSGDRREAVVLLTIAYAESRFCERVHSGEVWGGMGQGLFQLEPGSHRVPPFSGLSYRETEHAAGEAIALWRLFKCPTLAQNFGGYAGLGCKTWSGAFVRVALFNRINHRILP